jgi:hypothetical protein
MAVMRRSALQRSAPADIFALLLPMIDADRQQMFPSGR